MKRLHFYRCNDCLTVVTVDAELPMVYDQKTGGKRLTAVCDACNGSFEYMGRTIGAFGRGLERQVGERPVCDGRCTHARGPSCDCQCGGENHGAGVYVPVFVQDSIPRVMTPKNAAGKAETYRALVAEFKATWESEYGAVTRAKYERYLEPWEFSRFLDGGNMMRAFHRARDLRSHAGRNKAIQALTAEMRIAASRDSLIQG